MMNNKNMPNPMLCDPVTGVCEIPGTTAATTGNILPAHQKPVRIVYFTDPICSTCWGIEPQLRRLQLEYGDIIEIEYHMGGLLPSWDIYNSGGISKPSDVAHHWDEVGAYYEMPIDGDVWLEDPLPSSYPPSIAFKAAAIQDYKRALIFLRRIKEMVFLEKKNITKWEHLSVAAQEAGLDTAQFKEDYEGKAALLFQEDLDLGKKLGVRGFPTLFFSDMLNNQVTVYGFRPYEQYEQAILKLYPQAIPQPFSATLETLFSHYPTLTTKEVAVLSNKTVAEANALLDEGLQQGMLSKHLSKNGPLWALQSTTR